jgi:hypothetical protein
MSDDYLPPQAAADKPEKTSSESSRIMDFWIGMACWTLTVTVCLLVLKLAGVL